MRGREGPGEVVGMWCYGRREEIGVRRIGSDWVRNVVWIVHVESQ